MLVIGAKTIYPETVQSFRGRKIFYFIDALPRYESVYPIIPLFDEYFLFEPTDVKIVKDKFGLNAHFLTLAYSPSRYFKKNITHDVYDFSFVGSNYPKREEYLDSLLSVSENLCLYGDFYKSKYRTLRKKTKKVNAPFPLVNDLYNQSRININIHHPQSKEGLAIRTFEIIGAGGFQLVERQKAALEFFEENKHMAFYDSKEEFVDKADYFLKHDGLRKQIAENCYYLAMQKHTWKHRMKEMFEMMGSKINC
jgi:spore maturation protein CgeB